MMLEIITKNRKKYQLEKTLAHYHLLHCAAIKRV